MDKKIYFFLFIAVFSACTKDNQHPVPVVHVDFRINIESTQHIELNSIGGWAYYTGGFNGIVIYRVSQDEFTAFDRASPHDPLSGCRIIVEDQPLAVDTCSQSVFLLLDGSPVSGPSIYPLMQYQTYFNYPYLQVRNF